MIQILGNNYEKADRAQSKLLALESLKTCTVNELWGKYRQLSPSSMYLVASHFKSDSWTWYTTTKWDMFTNVDKAMRNVQNNPNEVDKIKASIESAILDQKKIMTLQRLNAVLLDETQGKKEKTDAFRQIEKIDRLFFEQIKYCIWVAHGEIADGKIDFGGEIIDTEPDAPLQLAVIKEMIRLIKDGYSDCKKHPGFFKGLRH